MERPRRNIRLPDALNDYLTSGECETKSATANKETTERPTKEEEGEEEEGSQDAEKLVLLQPYKCGECKARYRSKVALLRHAVKHSGEKPFLCSECGKGLSSQNALSEHMNIHTNSKPHRCDSCGQESRQLSVHLRHLLTHQSHPENLYTCTVCGKTFKQNEYLKKHKRKHTGEKPYECKECKKSFTCKSELNRHSKRHSGERPHQCTECGQSFKMRHNLRKHQKAHAGMQQWKCLLCSVVFSKPKLLEDHRRTHLETVQHLQVNRPDDNTLIVSAEGDDRRKLPSIHNVPLPKVDTDDLAASMQKKLLRINDTTLPLGLILKSVGKGNVIKIKIIDKPAVPITEVYTGNQTVVELVDEDTSKEGSSGFLDKSDKDTEKLRKTVNEEGEIESVNYEAVEVASVLSVPASIASHCLSKHYAYANPSCSDYCCWLATFSSLSQQLEPPFDLEVCKYLSHVMSSLQHCLFEQPGQGVQHESTQLLMTHSEIPTKTASCEESSHYQFIYEHYMTIVKILHSHFDLYMTHAK